MILVQREKVIGDPEPSSCSINRDGHRISNSCLVYGDLLVNVRCLL